MNRTINIHEKFQKIKEHWSPAIIAELNGQHVKVAKVLGEFVMHHHDHEDEMFMVIKGSIDMVYKDRIETVNEGEIIVVGKGMDHKPVAKEEAWILLFEPETTLNTGNVQNEQTKETLKRI